MKSKEELKIAVVPSYYPMKYSYTGSFFEEQVRLIRKKGINISVIYNEDRSVASFSLKKLWHVHFQTRYAMEENVPVLRRMNWNIIPARFNMGRKIWIKNTIGLVEKYIKNYGAPDLIHVHCLYNAGGVAEYIHKKWNIPYIVTEHSSDFISYDISPSKLKEVRSMCLNAEKIVAVSTYLKNVLHEKIGLDKEKMTTIPNFIDTEYFSPNGGNTTGKAEVKEKILLTICHASSVKRLDRLMEAFKIVSEHYPEWKLVIGGEERPEINNIKKTAVTLKLQDKVSFPGSMTKEQVRDYMKKAAIVISSSDIETFGVLLIEAMSMGLPIVATESGGPGDIVMKGTGLLVERNAESLAKGIMEVISKYDTYDKGYIRECAINNFGGKMIANKYIDLYYQIVNNK